MLRVARLLDKEEVRSFGDDWRWLSSRKAQSRLGLAQLDVKDALDVLVGCDCLAVIARHHVSSLDHDGVDSS